MGDTAMRAEIMKDVARVIVETSQTIAAGYRQDQCSHGEGETAAHNTGFFILVALGFSHDEVRAMFAKHNH